MLTLKVPESFVSAPSEPNLAITVGAFNINWVTKSKVTPVRNQRSCGSCWAFSAVAALESMQLIVKNVNRDYSEQQLVDCSGSYGNGGCKGGWMENAFKYIIANGIGLEKDYIYTAKDGSCKAQTKISIISSYKKVAGNCVNVINALKKNPLSVAVDANGWSSYKNGIFNNCGGDLNHGVLLVGATNTTWLIKNSWGTSWGVNGYMTIAKDGTNCRICDYASYPVI
jgi:C1A family cysteine protease